MNAKRAAGLAQPVRRISIVPRTHFDLAWWAKWAIFRHKFARVMEELVTALEANSELRFTLDSQAELVFWWPEAAAGSPLEQARRYDRIRRLVKRGQLQIGPALVLPDEFLAPPEALVRNLQEGLRVTRQFGAPEPLALDMSDVFGHPAQIPQLVAGFGLPYYLFSRGVGVEQEQIGPAFRWVAPDGTAVTALLQEGGYDNGMAFGRYDLKQSLRVVRWFMEQHQRRYGHTGLDDLLLYSGTDHAPMGNFIAQHTAECRQQFPDIEFQVATNDEYVRGLNLGSVNVTDYHGELYASWERVILRGVSSTRMYLKQKNEQLERLMLQTEAASALALLHRGPDFTYPHEEFRRLWRQYLVLQSHDAITGCHVDPVGRDMMAAYDDVEVVANRLLQEGLGEVCGRGADYGNDRHYGLPPRDKFVLWNPLPYRHHSVAVVALPEQLQGDRGLTAKVNGRDRQVQRLGSNRAAVPVVMGGFGSSHIALGQTKRRQALSAGRARVIDNGLLRVEVAGNGTFSLTDLATGQWLDGLHCVESIGDRGDEYNFDPVGPVIDNRKVKAEVRCVSVGPLVWELEINWALKLPQGIDQHMPSQWRRWAKIGWDWTVPRLRLPAWSTWRESSKRLGPMVSCPVRTTLRLTQGSRVLECDTTVLNQARDHRLQVVFPVGQTVDHSRAESPFLVERYPILPPTDPNWKARTTLPEPPFNEHTNHGLVAAGALAVFNRGLPEFEARQARGQTELALTLLRCVSHLSKDNLTTRRGGAGPGEPTPEAQCQGEHTFSYALSLSGETDDATLARAAQVWRNGLVVAPEELQTDGILEEAPDGGAWIYSALKGAEDGSGVVFRGWAGSQKAELSLVGDFTQATRVRLDETPAAEDSLTLSPHQIVSVRLTGDQ